VNDEKSTPGTDVSGKEAGDAERGEGPEEAPQPLPEWAKRLIDETYRRDGP
jgi:hypothetical protein